MVFHLLSVRDVCVFDQGLFGFSRIQGSCLDDEIKRTQALHGKLALLHESKLFLMETISKKSLNVKIYFFKPLIRDCPSPTWGWKECLGGFHWSHGWRWLQNPEAHHSTAPPPPQQRRVLQQS